ncbi:MAG: hypothetical protein ABIH03_14175 [Pseudomonadota bacterium]
MRDLMVCVNLQRPKLYRIGIRGRISRLALAEANERRDGLALARAHCACYLLHAARTVKAVAILVAMPRAARCGCLRLSVRRCLMQWRGEAGPAQEAAWNVFFI